MNGHKEIEVNGVRYMRIGESEGEEFRLVVVDNRGLTFVGYVDLRPSDSDEVVIRDARCVLCWGTTEHLAELANNGPTSKTLLGATATVTVFRHNLVCSYALDEEQWR